MASDADRVRVLSDEEGELLWFLGGLLTVKADSELTNGSSSVVEQRIPPNFAPPRHIHRDEDEMFYVLEGEMTVMADGRPQRAERGAFVFLPKGLEHSFLTGPDGVRSLIITTAPGKFADFVRAAGQRAAERAMPPPPSGPPSEKQQRMLAELSARFGVDITGPPITADDLATPAERR